MKLIVPPLEIPDDAGFDPEIDIFKRENYGKSLLNLICNTDDELSIGIGCALG